MKSFQPWRTVAESTPEEMLLVIAAPWEGDVTPFWLYAPELQVDPVRGGFKSAGETRLVDES